MISTGSSLPLYGFCAATALGVSAMGAAFALLPAYEADLFGAKYITAVHGRMLLYSSTAGVVGLYPTYLTCPTQTHELSTVGPAMLLTLRSWSEAAAIKDLLAKVRILLKSLVFGNFNFTDLT